MSKGMAAVLVLVLVIVFGPYIAAFFWNWSTPILFPRFVRDGYINANLDWWGGAALMVFAPLLFKRSGSSRDA